MPPRPRFTPPQEQPFGGGDRGPESRPVPPDSRNTSSRTWRADAAPAPVTLGGRQLDGQEITYPPQFLPVQAWVPFTDGTHQQVRALAVAWTRQAVKVVWRTGGEEPVEHQAWVWAPAVSRVPLPGPHATDNPATNVNRRPRPGPGSGPVPQFRPSVQPPRTRPW